MHLTHQRTLRFAVGLCLPLAVACGSDVNPQGPSDAGPTHDARVSAGTLLLESASRATGIRGEYNSVASAVSFSSVVDEKTGVVTARYQAQGTVVTVELADSGSATLRIGDVSMDGFGPLSVAEAQALAQVGSDAIATALTQVPLELGCRVDAEDTAAQRAALVFPWQMLIKYDPEFLPASYFAAQSSCVYFVDDPPAPDYISSEHALGLQLSYEANIPTVFGYFPLDAEGSVEKGFRLSHAGRPCGAKCPGTCGADCEPNNCTVTVDFMCELDTNGNNTGSKRAYRLKYLCGTHQGCRDHDSCYDNCNSYWGCGTWAASSCRHSPLGGCDSQCIATWGAANCGQWMFGNGPFDGFSTYYHPIPLGPPTPDPAMCPVVPFCGDAMCDVAYAETCGSCPQDCGACPDAAAPDAAPVDASPDADAGYCGNAFCDIVSETCDSCPSDCGSCDAAPLPDASYCGDTWCDVTTETCDSCPSDCGSCDAAPLPDASYCGDTWCDVTTETCDSCPSDCGSCDAAPLPDASYCGDTWCDVITETCDSCPSDCGACDAAVP